MPGGGVWMSGKESETQMSFDRKYPNRKDWRKEFRKSKAFDRSCRCHGACSYCQNNRLHSTTVREQAADDASRELK